MCKFCTLYGGHSRRLFFVKRVTLEQMAPERAGSAEGFDAVADGNDDVETTEFDRPVRICTMHFLHIAFPTQADPTVWRLEGPDLSAGQRANLAHAANASFNFSCIRICRSVGYALRANPPYITISLVVPTGCSVNAQEGRRRSTRLEVPEWHLKLSNLRGVAYPPAGDAQQVVDLLPGSVFGVTDQSSPAFVLGMRDVTKSYHSVAARNEAAGAAICTTPAPRRCAAPWRRTAGRRVGSRGCRRRRGCGRRTRA